jgi:DNA-binding NarL/FixJ family response regulator
VIAEALFASPGTIRKHLEHIYDKLEVRNRAEATAIFTQERVVKDTMVQTLGSGQTLA